MLTPSREALTKGRHKLIPRHSPQTLTTRIVRKFYPRDLKHIRNKLRCDRNVLRVPKVEFLDYPSCERLQTVSKNELKSAFCEHPFKWGERQFTYYSSFAKDRKSVV